MRSRWLLFLPVCVIAAVVWLAWQRPTGRTERRASSEQWRLKVVVRDERGRVYVETAPGELYRAGRTPLSAEVRGTVDVMVCVPGRVPRFFRQLSSPATGSRLLEVRTEPGQSITGRLIDDAGGPLPGRGVRVVAEPLDPPPWFFKKHQTWETQVDADGRWFEWAASTDANGTFRITGLPAGRYRVAARVGAAHPAILLRARPVDADAGATGVQVVCVRGVEVDFEFIDAETKKPVRHAVRWEAKDERGRVGASGVKLVVEPGRAFVLHARAEGYVDPNPLPVTAQRELGRQTVVVSLRPDAAALVTLTLRVRDDAGAPVPWIAVSSHSTALESRAEDGNHVVSLPAGQRSVSVETIVKFEPKEHEPPFLRNLRLHGTAYFKAEFEGGGQATREVVLQRNGVIVVHGTREGVRLLRDGKELRRAFNPFGYPERHSAAAVPPGKYVVERTKDEIAQKVEVEVRPAEVVTARFP